MKAFNSILVPTDFSECAQDAAEQARRLAERLEATIHVLHVVEPFIVAPALGESLPVSFVEERDARAEKELQIQVTVNEEAGLKTTSCLMHGSPFVEIVRYAREHGIDLIVMGTHGRTGLDHAIIGSVAENVVRKADCSVLTVRQDGHQL